MTMAHFFQYTIYMYDHENLFSSIQYIHVCMTMGHCFPIYNMTTMGNCFQVFNILYNRKQYCILENSLPLSYIFIVYWTAVFRWHAL